MTWLLIAWLIDRVQLKMTGATYGNAYCGMGTIDGVLARNIQAPMAYRVLVPWIIGIAERLFPGLRPHRLPALYEPLKIVLMAYAYWATSLALGVSAALVVAALSGVTFLFDYWDWAVELGGLALALSGRPELAVIGAVLWALSRETFPLAAVTYYLVTEDGRSAALIMMAAVCTFIAARIYVGTKALYCDRFMVKQNWYDLKRIMASRPVYMGEMAMTIVVTILTLVSVVSLPAAWPIPLVLLGAGWTMARAPETRVFSGCLLWIAPLVLRGLGYG